MRRRAAGLAVSLITCALAAGLLEAWASDPRRIPLFLQPYMRRPWRVLSQTSKQGILPSQYIALLGDSYAAGYGDWLISQAGQWTNPPFHSAHVLHDELGVDVVSFGEGGNDSGRAVAMAPGHDLGCLRARMRIDDPSLFIVYFYEGNDPQDNLGYLMDGWSASRFPPDPEGTTPLPRLPACRLLAQWAVSSARDMADFLRRRIPPRPPVPPEPRVIVKMGGESVALAGGDAQAPPADLTPEECALAVGLLEDSLASLRRQFPAAGVVVVYIPSVLACYPVVPDPVSLRSTLAGELITLPRALLAIRSDETAGLVRIAAERSGAQFFDPRPAIREAALTRRLHGPRDPGHFNRAGYELLGRELAKFVRAHGAAPPANKL